jgi:hypothetical protein
MLTATVAASAASSISTRFEAHEYDFSGDLATILPEESVTTKATCTLTAALLKVFRQHAIANNAHYCKRVITSINARQAFAAKVTPWLDKTIRLLGTYRKMDGTGPCKTLHKATEKGIVATAAKQKKDKPTAGYHNEYHTREVCHDLKERILKRYGVSVTDRGYLISDILPFFASYHDWEQSARTPDSTPFINEANSAKAAKTAFMRDVTPIWQALIKAKHGSVAAARWHTQTAEIIAFWADQVIVNATHPVFSFLDGHMHIATLEMVMAAAEFAITDIVPIDYRQAWCIHEVGLCDTALCDVHRTTMMPWISKGTLTAGALRRDMIGIAYPTLPDGPISVLSCLERDTTIPQLTGQSVRMATEIGLAKKQHTAAVSRLITTARTASDMVRFHAAADRLYPLSDTDITALFTSIQAYLKKEGGFIHAVQDHPQRYFELLAGCYNFIDPLLGSKAPDGTAKFGSKYYVDAWGAQAKHLLTKGSGLVDRLSAINDPKKQREAILQLCYIAAQQDGVRFAKMAAPKPVAATATVIAAATSRFAASGTVSSSTQAINKGPSGSATTAPTHTSSHSALRIDGKGITPTSTATV